MKNSILQGKSVVAHSLRTLVRMALAVVLLGGASAQAAERADGDAILVNNGWIGTQKTLIWRGVSVADLADFSCLIWGGSAYVSENSGVVNGTNGYHKVIMPHGEATGFVMSSSDTEAVVQFRRFVDGTIWCVKATFTQGDDGVYVQANWARYTTGAADINTDLETTFKGNMNVATSSTSNGYGAYQVTARCLSRKLPPDPIVCPAAHQYIPYEAPVLFWKNAKWSDLSQETLNVWMRGNSMNPRYAQAFIKSNADGRARVQFRSREDKASATMWCVLVDLFKNGDCIYGQAAYSKYAQNTTSIDVDFDSKGNFNGKFPAGGYNEGGYGVYQISAAFNGQHSPFFTGVCGAWLTSSAYGDRLIWRNVPLARVRNVRGVAGGGSTHYSPASEQHRIFTPGTNGNPDTLEVQLNYYDGNNTRCLIVLFTQQGTDVMGYVKAAKYNQGPVDFDFFTGGNSASIANDLSVNGYGISRLQADIAPEDGVTTQQTDAGGNRFVLAGTADSVTDLSLAGTLTVNGAGPFALNGVNELGALAVEGHSSVQTKIKDYWFNRQDIVYHVSEFVVGGNGVNTLGQLAWRDVTQLDKRDGGWQVGLTLSGSNTVAAPFIPPSYAFFRIKSGRTSLPFLAPSTAELGNGSLFAVDEGATLAIGGYDHQGDYPVHFAVQGTLDVADTLTLDGGASLTGTGIVTAKAIASTASSNTLGGVTLVPPAEGCALSGAVTVTSAGLTLGEGRTALVANANLAGGKVTVRGTLAVPAAATVKTLDLAGGTLEIDEDTLLTVTDPLTTVGTVRVVSADRRCSAWRTPRPFLKGPNLTAKTVSRIVDTSGRDFTWEVSVADVGGTKVCSLSCHPSGFSLIVK